MKNGIQQWTFQEVTHLDHCFQVELELGILVYVEEGKPEDLEKNPRNKDENNHKLNPHVISGPGVESSHSCWFILLDSYRICFVF